MHRFHPQHQKLKGLIAAGGDWRHSHDDGDVQLPHQRREQYSPEWVIGRRRADGRRLLLHQRAALHHGKNLCVARRSRSWHRRTAWMK